MLLEGLSSLEHELVDGTLGLRALEPRRRSHTAWHWLQGFLGSLEGPGPKDASSQPRRLLTLRPRPSSSSGSGPESSGPPCPSAASSRMCLSWMSASAGGCGHPRGWRSSCLAGSTAPRGSSRPCNGSCVRSPAGVPASRVPGTSRNGLENAPPVAPPLL